MAKVFLTLEQAAPITMTHGSAVIYEVAGGHVTSFIYIGNPPEFLFSETVTPGQFLAAFPSAITRVEKIV